MRHPLRTAAMGACALLCIAAAASDPTERLHDPAREARARDLFRQIRCPVCQNESIDESDAPLADDLRRIVRQEIAAGSSDAQVRAFLVRRYGEFVLLQPRFSPANALLWLTPFAIVGAGATIIAFGRRTVELEPPLSGGEEARLDGLIVGAQANSHGSAAPPPHG